VVSRTRGRMQPFVTAGAGYEIYRFIEPVPPARSLHYPIAHVGAGFRYHFVPNAALRMDVSSQLSSHRPTISGLLTGISWYPGLRRAPARIVSRVDTLRTTRTVHDTVTQMRARVDTLTRTRVDTVMRTRVDTVRI